MEVICLTPELKKLKEKIQALIEEETKTLDMIYISVVYYEVNTYKKPLPVKGKKKK